jgi:hypothetical protein
MMRHMMSMLPLATEVEMRRTGHDGHPSWARAAPHSEGSGDGERDASRDPVVHGPLLLHYYSRPVAL